MPRFSANGQPQDPGGSVSGGTGGTTGTSSSPGGTASNIANLTVTGGLSGFTGSVLVFGQDTLQKRSLVWQFNSDNFNCEEDCEYDFRVEEVEVYRQPTINNVIIRYRDLGQVTVNCFFIGNVLGDQKVSKIVTVVFGGKADKKIYTVKFDLTCTFEAPQLIITRNANAGPLSITKVLVEIQHGDIKPQ